MNNIFNEITNKISMYDAYLEELTRIYQEEDDDITQDDVFDSIDGEIDITSSINKLGRLLLKEEAYLNSFKERVDNIQLRHKKQKEKVDQLKKLMLKIIDKTNLKTPLKFPEFTASVSERDYGKLKVDEECIIPDEFYKVEKSVDNSRLKERLIQAYENNDTEFLESLVGVSIETKTKSLTIRKK